MKKLLLAAVMFTAPIIFVVVANPKATADAAKDVYAWAQKTFPAPEPAKAPQRRRG